MGGADDGLGLLLLLLLAGGEIELVVVGDLGDIRIAVWLTARRAGRPGRGGGVVTGLW
ncbi:hypothetical protein ACIOC1_34340 [Streptomyces sp. NPDC088197]|uniref:hypothetical protein n=1 Tax=Streptomyces sp. NPDC088197 TaxID=3365840 RepID=UPI0037F540A2